MKLDNKCFSCALNSLERNLDSRDISNNVKKESTQKFLDYMSHCDLSISPPDLGRELHNYIKKVTNEPDPFKDVKKHFNQLLLSQYSMLENIIANSENRFKAALKLSILGNIIDFGVKKEFKIQELINAVDDIEFTIDESDMLYDEIAKSNKILYLGDNAGEIVLDKLLIEIIFKEFRIKDITFAVRSEPIINDVTIEDADEVGLTSIINVIENGYDAPGTVLGKCSDEFLNIYNNSDLVISKGQGNFETLNEEKKNIFFLLMSKCDVVAESLGVPKGSLVVKKM